MDISKEEMEALKRMFGTDKDRARKPYFGRSPLWDQPDIYETEYSKKAGNIKDEESEPLNWKEYRSKREGDYSYTFQFDHHVHDEFIYGQTATPEPEKFDCSPGKAYKMYNVQAQQWEWFVPVPGIRWHIREEVKVHKKEPFLNFVGHEINTEVFEEATVLAEWIGDTFYEEPAQPLVWSFDYGRDQKSMDL